MQRRHCGVKNASSAQIIRLTRLREIGWSLWDPIGLAPLSGAFSIDDEYDAYLIEAAIRLRAGEDVDSVVAYLVTIEVEHMGMGLRSTTAHRALATVEAIKAYVESLSR